jgi:2'-5' RNA ligase
MPFPAAEAAVGQWRSRLDPSADLGVPAHVTVHFPWLAAEHVDDDALGQVTALASGTPPFDVVFRRVGWFGRQVAWLDPEPRETFTRLLTDSAARWPDHPPFEGQFDTVVPHLTLGMGPSPDLDDAVAQIASRLPIHDVAAHIWWMTRAEHERWTIRRTFPLGQPA